MLYNGRHSNNEIIMNSLTNTLAITLLVIIPRKQSIYI